jgi:hypothetical protein
MTVIVVSTNGGLSCPKGGCSQHRPGTPGVGSVINVPFSWDTTRAQCFDHLDRDPVDVALFGGAVAEEHRYVTAEREYRCRGSGGQQVLPDPKAVFGGHDDRRCLSQPRRWRYLDMGQSHCYLQSFAPRVRCPAHGVVVAAVLWARHNARMTTAFEDTGAWLAARMTLSCPALPGRTD